ncbi:MAG: hypothetical protein R3208_00590 [Ketobacteraceae bacterium]|nr:hypothetical protein [Ketobacteraceae bacterium]
MEFRYRYPGNSQVSSDPTATAVSFAPDTLRPPTFFVGQLDRKLPFREAISALHNVVVSDMRFKPKDRTDYNEWLKEQEQHLLAEFIARKSSVEARVSELRSELNTINRSCNKVLQPYYKAQADYFKYLYKHDRDAWIVLDPVITINPDELFFECFSEDESSYGKLSCRFGAFKNISENACGTTNIDYSEGLYQEFQKIRDYRDTTLSVDPSGFEVATSGSDAYEEKKIDLPDSWVRGFLQVSSAMTLPTTSFRLHPMDVHNICHLLKRQKERVGPRALRFELEPGKPVVIHFEPWNHRLECPRSVYTGNESRSVRVWGRRRLHILERLIPVSSHFDVHLLGDGMPSFYVAHMADMTFTLGLSGWSANDWSRMGNFDLLSARQDVDELTLKRIYNALKSQWVATPQSLSQELQLDPSLIQSALTIYSQHGQVLYDITQNVYRIRELSREPLPFNELRFVNDREEKANRFIQAHLVELDLVESNESGTRLRGTVKDNARDHQVSLFIDNDLRLKDGSCQCHFFVHNRLRKGPCEHMLALRLHSVNEIQQAAGAAAHG